MMVSPDSDFIHDSQGLFIWKFSVFYISKQTHKHTKGIFEKDSFSVAVHIIMSL